jgi:hypothetical protein
MWIDGNGDTRIDYQGNLFMGAGGNNKDLKFNGLGVMKFMGSGGGIQYDANPGAVEFFQLNVDSSPSAGTEQSAEMNIASEAFLTLYSEADGSGGIQNGELRVSKPVDLQSEVVDNADMLNLKATTLPTCDSSTEGDIRYDGSKHYGCDGSSWSAMY